MGKIARNISLITFTMAAPVTGAVKRNIINDTTSPALSKLIISFFTFLDEQMKIDSDFHKFATQIEGNRGDLSNSIAFYKWWMMKMDLWDNRINLDTIWE